MSALFTKDGGNLWKVCKHDESAVPPPATRMYECKKCRQLRSFQALGGHIQEPPILVGRHECSNCVRCFLTDQVLGGHMTMYRWLADNVGRKKPMDIDLNLPPLADDREDVRVRMNLVRDPPKCSIQATNNGVTD
ncbi:hypothetical protein EJ110_NYTH27802 [Nymphaea thermarum]|nr:hypothetical protein EJ110_NYTH27802 [Nymphaea thermarum]